MNIIEENLAGVHTHTPILLQEEKIKNTKNTNFISVFNGTKIRSYIQRKLGITLFVF